MLILIYINKTNKYIQKEGNMRTLIDIQDDLMNELLKEANTTVKKEAIIIAIKTFLDVKRREKLASLMFYQLPEFLLLVPHLLAYHLFEEPEMMQVPLNQ